MNFTVPPIGPRNAKIALVGEAPGQDEVLKGEPFVGASGHLLNDMLRAVGINRQDCYITNVSKVRPQNNDFKQFYLDKSCRQPTPFLINCWKELSDELLQVHPNIIVALGGEPLRALTGKQGITKWRGSLLQTPTGLKLLPTFHPASTLRAYDQRPITELDLRRVLAESTNPELKLPEHRFLLGPSIDTVLTKLKELRSHRRIAFDIETSGPLTRCLGLAWSPLDAICIPFISHPPLFTPNGNGGALFTHREGSTELNSYWSLEEEYEILKALHELFQTPSVEFILQNAPFDLSVLWKDFGITIHHLYMDTMVAHHTCYCELPKGLDFLCSLYTRVPYYSDYDPAVDEDTWRYNCFDSAVTFECSVALDREMEELGVKEFYYSHINPTIPALIQTQSWGVKIDTELRAKMATETEAKVKDLETKLKLTGGPEFNPNSDKQVKDLLYGKLRLPPVLHRKTKAPTTDKNALETLSNRFPQHKDLFNDLRTYSELQTLLSGFLRKELGPDGRIRTSYSIAGTVNGRLSSSEPLFDPGTNLQNIPIRTESGATFRRMFVADPGFVLIKTDLSQVQWRVVTWLARISWLIEEYSKHNGYDVHRWLASKIYKVAEEVITKAQRGVAKNGIYGGAFKMYERTAATTYHLPIEVARHVLGTFRGQFPEVVQWWSEVEREINSKGFLQSPLGRKRIFFGRREDQLYRDAFATVPQMVEADIISRALHLGVEIFPSLECHPVLQVHDEIVWSTREDLVLLYVPKIRAIMEYPISFPSVDRPLVVPVEISSGPNWLDQVKTPEVPVPSAAQTGVV